MLYTRKAPEGRTFRIGVTAVTDPTIEITVPAFEVGETTKALVVSPEALRAFKDALVAALMSEDTTFEASYVLIETPDGKETEEPTFQWDYSGYLVLGLGVADVS